MKDSVRGVAISHPDRQVFSDPGLTKLELARYYASVADRMLPHLRERRLVLLKCPEGADDACFVQRHEGRRLPEGVSLSEGHLVIQTAQGLVGLVQQGVIEFHTWGARDAQGARPDRITLDLDPDDSIGWPAVVDAARAARELMEHVGLVPFLKTTGGKGLHLVAPIRPTQSWDTIKDLARRMADQLAAAAPDTFIATASKARRKGLVFVDYLRNGDAASAVAAWSVRARPGAPVSMPLDWKALDPGHDLRGAAFNVRNALEHAQGRADPWRGYADSRRSVGPRMQQRLPERPA
ncbi:non-homologous end-joining DNA ligase [Bordetella genomosp. 13]|uniref:non-homologous end-joining DNA ligase n=1 Tax=Bordetella genomosp. 13 TaxID=463040 RepID=UPI00119CECD4|nr:non-homologous end-joining DNA ligase [Bordetella genomosp. 13]